MFSKKFILLAWFFVSISFVVSAEKVNQVYKADKPPGEALSVNELEMKIFPVGDYEKAEQLLVQIETIISKNPNAYVDIYRRGRVVLLIVKAAPLEIDQISALVYTVEESRRDRKESVKKVQPGIASQKEIEHFAEPAPSSSTPVGGKKEEGLPVVAEQKKIPAPIKEEKVAKKVSLNFKNAPLGDVLNTLSKLANINIIGADDLSVPVTLYVNEIPLEDALYALLKGVGYHYIREKNIFYIMPRNPSADTPLDAFLTTKVFSLNYISATTVGENISSLLSAKGEVNIFSEVSDEENARKLVVKDFPANLEIISQLIKNLDKKPTQVVIETKFVEVTLTEDFQLGIDWAIEASMAGSEATTTFPFGARGQRIPEKGSTEGATTSISTLGTVSFSNFQATLKAKDNNAKVEVISNPRVTTHSGEEAEILVGTRVPIPIYERNPDTATLEVIGYQEEEFGIVLKVTPFVNEDSSITMHLEPEVSSQSGSTGPNDERPIISTNEVKTLVTVKNGSTIVLGGLRKKDNTDTRHSVPILGQLPLFGKLFTYESRDYENKELLIFLTPRIMGDEVKELAEQKNPNDPGYNAD